MDDDRGRAWTPGGNGLLAAASIALLGLFLFLWRIGDPQRLNFDESFYVPAARVLNALDHPTNIEHPLLGKWLIGQSIRLFGDTPEGWRIMSALFGAAALFGLVMAASWALRSVRAGAMAGGFALLGQLLFVMARVAMLDIFLAGLLMLGLWMIAAAARAQRGNRWRIMLAGLLFGLAAGCKWTAIPLLAAIVLALCIWRGRTAVVAGRGLKGWLLARDLAPACGLSLVEALLWLGPAAAAAYLATFLPAFHYRTGALAPSGLIAFQFEMLVIQQWPMAPHSYQSVPWQWMLDLRPIWFFYEPVDGIQRGVLLVGNPVVMWAGLAAVPAALWLGIKRREGGLAGLALAYLIALGIWLVIPKPVMFYHHYLTPSLLLCAVLAGTLDRLWLAQGSKAVPVALLAAAMLVFWDFYPILSAVPLDGPGAFQRWMWFDSWR